MPLINVKVIEDVFSDTQKAQVIQDLTEAMVAIEGEGLRPYTWVVVEEVRSGDWGIGGKGLGATDVRSLQGQPATATG